MFQGYNSPLRSVFRPSFPLSGDTRRPAAAVKAHPMIIYTYRPRSNSNASVRDVVSSFPTSFPAAAVVCCWGVAS